MPYYETIFETGAVSVAFYENDQEALSALAAHHDRAKNGLPAVDGSPRPAERISKALKYDNHPADYGVGEEVATAEVKSALADAMKELEHDGTVKVPELVAAVRDIVTGPLVESREHRHDSIFTMEETEALDPKSWDE